MKIQPYPTEILDLQYMKGFSRKFYSFCVFGKTYKKAYEDTEILFFKYFGRNKFASYDSFRVCLSKYHKKSLSSKLK